MPLKKRPHSSLLSYCNFHHRNCSDFATTHQRLSPCLSRIARAKCHRLSGLNSRTSSSRFWRLEGQVQGARRVDVLPLGCRWPPPHCVLTWPSHCTAVDREREVWFLFLLMISQIQSHCWFRDSAYDFGGDTQSTALICFQKSKIALGTSLPC